MEPEQPGENLFQPREDRRTELVFCRRSSASKGRSVEHNCPSLSWCLKIKREKTWKKTKGGEKEVDVNLVKADSLSCLLNVFSCYNLEKTWWNIHTSLIHTSLIIIVIDTAEEGLPHPRQGPSDAILLLLLCPNVFWKSKDSKNNSAILRNAQQFRHRWRRLLLTMCDWLFRYQRLWRLVQPRLKTNKTHTRIDTQKVRRLFLL